ncbi:MAG: ABC transporter permease subunit [Planctomycetes bacterium]|nr:ABC transporter permease subunit [Planctomycetota bacterium]
MSTSPGIARSPSFARGAWVVAKREAGASLDARIAAVTTCAFVVLVNAIFMNEFFLNGVVGMDAYFRVVPLLLPFFLAAVTMRLFAEERKTRTLELLLTLPVAPAQVVLGKFVAAFLLVGLFLLGALPIVVMLCALGDPDLGLVFGGMFGIVLASAVLIALGMFVSALVTDQIVAFVVTAVCGVVLVLLGNDAVVAVLDGLAPTFAVGTALKDAFSLLPHLEAAARGELHLAAVVHAVAFSTACLWSTTRALERARA